ncbi:MAG: glucose uptake permease [Acidobacteria bacterium]|nr:MAG: glucose uptake permease [Acidobacteriota bacterium]
MIETVTERSRQQKLQSLGIFCGFAAALWLAGAEAPTKLVTVAVSPFVISFMMVLGAFVSRWSLPALVMGTSGTFSDIRNVPHLIVWGVMAGCLWAIGNTLTVFAVRDIGLSIAFPLWNANSLIAIIWGTLLFRELHRAGWLRWLGVVGGASVMFVGAVLLSFVSSSHSASAHSIRGVAAALGAGLMFGSQYIPFRKAYITGLNPFTFLTFFTFGEMTTMTILAVSFAGGWMPFWRQLTANNTILFWPLLGGFMWVIGDLFQNYAAKYVGISRGVPLSNTNQLWGLVWATMVFSELHGTNWNIYAKVAGGSLLMALGALAIAFSSATPDEYTSWREAAKRESDLYGIEPGYVTARMEGSNQDATGARRTWVDWLLITTATCIFIGFGALARVPHMDLQWGWLVALTSTMLLVLVAGGLMLWRITRFN